MNFNNLYSPKVLDHVRHPRNMGEIKNPDSEATVGNAVCGDIMKLYLKIKNDKITDIKFQTLGCGAAISSSSMLTIMAKGRSLSEAEKISREKIAEELGGLPQSKIHCSVLAAEALKKAIANYRAKK